MPKKNPIGESWGVLAADRTILTPATGVVLGTTTTEKFTRQIVRVEWRPNDEFELYIIMPPGVKYPPAVLFLYSYPADTFRFMDDDWCAHAVAGGVAAVGFTSALTGDRFHDRPMKEWFVSELQEALGKTVHDVQFILDYLAIRGDIDMDHIGMFGQGSGGTIALLAAQADPRLQAVDVLNPWGDWPDWLKDCPQIDAAERPNFLKPDFLKNVATLDPVIYLSQLKTPFLRLQLVSDDALTPESARRKIAAAAPPGDLVSYATSAELRTSLETNGIWSWMDRHLKPAPVNLQVPATPSAAASKPPVSAAIQH